MARLSKPLRSSELQFSLGQPQRNALDRLQLYGLGLESFPARHGNFNGTAIKEADLYYAIPKQIVFADVNLATSVNWNNARHSGPSSVGVDTILKSCGGIPG